MIYTDLTNKAMNIAYNSHHGQLDKGGIPYIFHPIHIAEQMDDEVSTCVAMLHDVVEDTDVTIEDLEKDFPPEVTEVVKVLTRLKGELYEDYIDRVCRNPVAVKVKLVDLAHNLDSTRVKLAEGPAKAKAETRRERYLRAIKVLNGGI